MIFIKRTLFLEIPFLYGTRTINRCKKSQTILSLTVNPSICHIYSGSLCNERQICRSKILQPYPAVYNASDVEKGWYDWWKKSGFFSSSETREDKEIFSMILPPPNITGTLHLGHALTVTIQDVLVRWKRMKGE